MKKLTSIFLVLAMLLTLAPMNVFAADAETTVFPDMSAIDYYAPAATALKQLEILSGYPDGTFGADKAITRAEMASIVCRMIDKGAESDAAKGETVFDDVSADYWASGYINIASKEGIISGDGTGKFLPENDVKYEEALKMVVCALGYGEGIVVDTADWSKGFLEVAAQKGISANLKGAKGIPATRGDIAVMSYNGLATDTENSKIPAIPVASKEAGTYKGTQKIKLTTVTKDATIYYTLDGTTPTEKSTKYKKEISIPKTSTLKAIAVKDGIVSKVLSATYTIEAASGGGGGGGSYTPPTVSITAAELQVNSAAATTANVGDVLTLVTTPADATGTITWTVGGKAIEATGKTYTVTAFDMGKTVKAQIVGTDSYEGTVSAECTIASSTQVKAEDIMSDNVDSSPVVLTDATNTTFLDDEGNPVEINAESTITLSIDKPEKSSEEVSAAQTIIIEDIVANSGVDAEDLEDVTTTAVDVNLSVDETAVHPVGDVTVNLSASQLGLPEETDLTLHTFSASHTNKNGDEEIVTGEVVTIDNIQYVRFELNGLSTIWIGNVPPRTVSFYNTEYDADNKVNSIGSVIVKFGDFTPTAKIPTPSLSGYLFCGWNFDMTRTPIIYNLEVHALWIEGEKMPQDNISAIFSEDTDAFTLEISDGLVNVGCEDTAELPADLDMKVTVTAPIDAVKYYVGTDAAVVAAFNDADEYIDIDTFADICFEVDVTDESGVIVPSSATYYYKWIDSFGEAISIQEVEAKIANGTDSATSMEYTANVDRGFGTFEAYLIDNDDPTKDFVAYINNHLNGRALEGYTLYNNVSFDEYRIEYDFSSYDALKLVFTPFEGESFSNSDSITATGEYYDGEDWVENWNGTYQISGENLIVTYPFSAIRTASDYGDLYISLNGVEQTISVNWYGGGEYRDDESIDCETWEEVVAALQNVSTTTRYHIYCEDSSAITLSASLKIPANVNINLGKAQSFTVANGAVLTLEENKDWDESANINISKGDFILADGGKIATTFTGRDAGTTYLTSVRAQNITLESGSNVTIPRSTGIHLTSTHYYDDAEKGVLTIEDGAVVNNYAHFHINDFDVANINGTINGTGYPYIHCDEININGTIDLEAENYYGRLELYGTVNIGKTGTVSANSTNGRNRASIEIYGPLTNNGTIEIKGNGANAEIMNNGFAIYNNGTISVENSCSITTSGTKYINTGLITGDGVLKAYLGDDYTNYDDGTEYVYVDDDEYWDDETGEYVYLLSDYSRYKYTHDPAETADVILYLPEIVNMGTGRCDLTIDAEEFPEN